MDWNKYRREDGTINLVEAFEDKHCGEMLFNAYSAENFLISIENYQKIKSRQIAALALAQADIIARQLPNLL
jgi:hypothetical protein